LPDVTTTGDVAGDAHAKPSTRQLGGRREDRGPGESAPGAGTARSHAQWIAAFAAAAARWARSEHVAIAVQRAGDHLLLDLPFDGSKPGAELVDRVARALETTTPTALEAESAPGARLGVCLEGPAWR